MRAVAVTTRVSGAWTRASDADSAWSGSTSWS